MKNIFSNSLITIAILTVIATSCSKPELVNIYKVPPVAGVDVGDLTDISGTIKGTLKVGRTYNMVGNIIVNFGDTLWLQNGVTVNVKGEYGFYIRGVMISLGTKSNPNWITYPAATKTDNPTQDPTTDAALQGRWAGISCDTTCPLFILKWTHVEFAGAFHKSPPSMVNVANNAKSYPILFQNPNGFFIMEDSWLYGSVDDAIRTYGGKIHVMRNTFEKCGFVGGEGINTKVGTVGNVAYNVFIGMATNGPKASNKGVGTIQTNMAAYNNTILNSGYRRNSTGRGGSINYEEGAKGFSYNDLIVNCKYGFRVVQNPPADTLNLTYGNHYYYGDSLAVVNQFYPTAYVTHPQISDFPLYTSYLPSNYTLGMIYNAPTLVSVNDPKFVNFPLPMYNYQKVAYVGTYDFHLQSSSPAIGKGTTSFSPISNGVIINARYGANEITLPGADMGAYQSNGTGNQH